MDAARHRLVGVIIKHGGMHPVSTAINELHLDTFVRLHRAFFFHFSPFHSPKGFAVVLDFHARRRGGGDFYIRRTAFVVLSFTPPLEIVVDERIGTVFRERVGVCRNAPVYFHFHIKGFLGILWLWKSNLDFTARVPRHRVFVKITECDGGDDEIP